MSKDLVKKLYNYLLKENFEKEASFLLKISNDSYETIDFDPAVVSGLSPRVKKALKELSVKTGHSMAVLTELYVENKQEMEALFPNIIKKVSLSADMGEGSTTSLDGKLINNKFVLLSEKKYNSLHEGLKSDFQQLMWPFNYKMPDWAADSGGEVFDEVKDFYKRFSFEQNKDYVDSKISYISSRLEEKKKRFQEEAQKCQKTIDEAVRNNSNTIRLRVFDKKLDDYIYKNVNPRTFKCEDSYDVKVLKESIDMLNGQIAALKNKSKSQSVTKSDLKTSDGASNEYLVNIGCGYYYVSNFSKNSLNKPVIVKLSKNKVNSLVKGESFDSEYGWSNQFTYYASKKDLAPKHLSILGNISGCDIRDSFKPKDAKSEVKRLINKTISKYDQRPPANLEVSIKAPEKPVGAYDKVIDFVYCDYSPPKYRDFFRGPNTVPVKIFQSVLEEIKVKDISLYNKLQKQKLQNFNNLISGKSKEEISEILNGFLCLDEIKDIQQKYSGGKNLDPVNYLPLRYDIGTEVTPDGKHIPVPLDKRFEK
jgi:hypothetical protein